LYDGTFVTDVNVKIDPYMGHTTNADRKSNKYNKYNKKSSSSYKGPDDDGYYLSYEFVLRDKAQPQGTHVVEDEKESNPENDVQTDVSLQSLLPFLHAMPVRNNNNNNNSNDNNNATPQYRLIVRQFRAFATRRRIRTMISKITSYTKKRRQKLVVKESSAPCWQGVLMLVLGLIGCLLSVLLGQLWQEEEYTTGSNKSMQQKRRARQQQQQRMQQQAKNKASFSSSAISSKVSTTTTRAKAPTAPTPTMGPGARRRPEANDIGGSTSYNSLPPSGQTTTTTRKRY
jgi:hypothetical protein